MRHHPAALLPALLLVVSCSWTSPPEASLPPTATQVQVASPSPTATPVATLAWETQTALIGDPAVTDEAIVSYIRTESGIALAGFDPATGVQRWRRAAVPGGTPTGVAINAFILKEGDRQWTSAVAASANDRHQLFVLDAVTGESVPVSAGEFWAISRPHRCGEGSGICLSAFLADDDEPTALRIDPVARSVGPDTTLPLIGSARFLGTRVFSTNDRPAEGGTELLGYVDDGGPVWSRPYTEVFGPGTSSDGGWSWLDDHPDGPLIGVGGTYPPGERKAGTRLPIASDVTVSLDRATGEVLWRLDGAGDCPMDLPRRPDDGEVLIACLVSAGEWVLFDGEDGNLDSRPENLVVDAVGIDIATGAVRWSQPLDPAGYNWDSHWLSGDDALVLQALGGELLIVDPVTGESRPAAGADLACTRAREDMTLHLGGQDRLYSTGEGRYPCDAEAAELPAWTPEALAWAGRESGDLTVVAGVDALRAFRVTPS